MAAGLAKKGTCDMKILLTGGAGYIGSHTCVELTAKGYDVVIADNFYNANPIVIDRIEEIWRQASDRIQHRCG